MAGGDAKEEDYVRSAFEHVLQKNLEGQRRTRQAGIFRCPRWSPQRPGD